MEKLLTWPASISALNLLTCWSIKNHFQSHFLDFIQTLAWPAERRKSPSSSSPSSIKRVTHSWIASTMRTLSWEYLKRFYKGAYYRSPCFISRGERPTWMGKAIPLDMLKLSKWSLERNWWKILTNSRISCLSPVPNIGNPLFVKSTDSTLGSVRRTWKRKVHMYMWLPANSNFRNIEFHLIHHAGVILPFVLKVPAIRRIEEIDAMVQLTLQWDQPSRHP